MRSADNINKQGSQQDTKEQKRPDELPNIAILHEISPFKPDHFASCPNQKTPSD
jgi:hypothetical protein